MLAAVLRQVGDDELDVVDDLEIVEPGPGQVQVKIEATGLCHSDLSMMTGVIPGLTPAVLGHEGAGVVEAVGEGVTRVKEGDHVIVDWCPPCGSCAYCGELGASHLCTDGLGTIAVTPNFLEGGSPVFGFAGNGTFAERMILLEAGVIKIDDDIPFEIASLIGCGVMTGVGAALNKAKVQPGSSVVVFGCGGVGIAAIQGARIAGAAEIVAVDLNEGKLETAKGFGASHAVVPDDLNGLKAELTGGEGFDYAFEAIGKSLTMRAAWDAIRRGGTACIIGAGAVDDFVTLSAFEIFSTDKSFVGSYYGSGDNGYWFPRLLRLWKAGRLDLEGMISRRMKIDEINDGLEAMRAGDVVRQVITF
jgi:S-(hydroxymethyl)glutathione dehydrogenase / alcohol dehydrogenase